MQTTVILAHPEPASFNAELARIAKEQLGGSTGSSKLVDLYGMGFDPLERGGHFRNRQYPGRFDAQAEQRHAAETDTLPEDVAGQLKIIDDTDLLILQYPMWWYTPPAILKGWLDRVLVYGRAYTGRRRYDAGVFKGKRAMLSVTTGAPEATFSYNGRNGDIDLLLWPLNFTLHYVGFTVLEPCIWFGVEGGLKYSDESSAAQRLRGYFEGYKAALKSIDQRPSIPFSGWDDWDDDGRLKPGAVGHSPFMREQP
ncbi:MAG: NAD(P)H-dependent oxidoreductase [Pseudomonadota bacterium]